MLMFFPSVVDLIVNVDMGMTRRRAFDSEQSANFFICRQYPTRDCHRRPCFRTLKGRVSDAEANILALGDVVKRLNTSL